MEILKQFAATRAQHSPVSPVTAARAERKHGGEEN